jgi:hypothetical protein
VREAVALERVGLPAVQRVAQRALERVERLVVQRVAQRAGPPVALRAELPPLQLAGPLVVRLAGRPVAPPAEQQEPEQVERRRQLRLAGSPPERWRRWPGLSVERRPEGWLRGRRPVASPPSGPVAGRSLAVDGWSAYWPTGHAPGLAHYALPPGRASELALWT